MKLPSWCVDHCQVFLAPLLGHDRLRLILIIDLIAIREGWDNRVR